MNKFKSRIASYAVGAGIIIALIAAPFALQSLWLMVGALALGIACFTLCPKPHAVNAEEAPTMRAEDFDDHDNSARAA